MMEEKEKAWKTVSSKYLFRRPWLTVRCEDMLLPNGNHIPEYYILEYPDWVNTIAITKDGKFVFVRQYRPGLGRTSYELCAGVCDKEDASPLVSAQRELWEETGYGKGNWQEYMVISANPSTHTNLTHCFLATDVEPIDHQHLEDTEDLSVHLLTFEEVKQLLENNEIMQSLNAAPCALDDTTPRPSFGPKSRGTRPALLRASPPLIRSFAYQASPSPMITRPIPDNVPISASPTEPRFFTMG